MAQIHPTARTDDDAVLESDAVIGPFCKVEGPVRIGRGVRLISHVTLRGSVHLGADTVVYPHVSLTAGGGVVELGPENIVREHVHVECSTAGATRVGARNYLMVGVRIGAGAAVGDEVTLVNQTVIRPRCVIGDRALVSGAVHMAEQIRVGRMATIGGVSRVDDDIPPFCIYFPVHGLAGLNIVGLRRAGLRQHIAPLRAAFRTLFRKGLAVSDAVDRVLAEQADDLLCIELAEFVRSSSWARENRRVGD